MPEPKDIKDFKAGFFEPQIEYKSFSPTLVNREWIVSDPAINSLLAEANRKLGELNAFSLYVPDVDIFILMHILKEATSSSRIEGTRTNIEEAVLQEKDINPERGDCLPELVQSLEIGAKSDSYRQRLGIHPKEIATLRHGISVQLVKGGDTCLC